MEYATNMGFNDISCTSMPCEWNSSTRKDVQPWRLSALNPKKDDRRKMSGSTLEKSNENLEFKLKYDPRREDHKTVSGAEVEKLYSSLHSVLPKAVLFTGFPCNKPKTTVPKNLIETGEELAGSDCYTDNFIEKISLTPEPSVVIETVTKGQNNNTWLTQRKGRVTASIFHDVGTKMDELLKKQVRKTTPLFSKVLGTSSGLENIPAVKYGRQNEPVARQLFSTLESGKHRHFSVKQSGLFIMHDRPYIAGSPDGIVSCQCCPDSILEIKCQVLSTNHHMMSFNQSII